MNKPRPTAVQARDIARIRRYLALYERAIATREAEDPDWRTRALLSVIDSALHQLSLALRQGKRVRWSSPFWAFQYPVQWDWQAWRWNQTELPIRYGELSSQNTRNRAQAIRALAEMGAREQVYRTLQHVTHEVSTYKRGRYQHPMLPEPLAESVRSLPTRRQQQEALEDLFHPFSIGAAEIELPENLKPGQKIPRRLAEQLARRTRNITELICPMTLDDHPISVRIIFQVFPLTIDDRAQRAYFPITIGVVLTSDEPRAARRQPKWLDPRQWTARDRQRFWQGLSKFIQHLIGSLKPQTRSEVTQEIQRVTTRMEVEMEATSPDDVQRSASQVLDELRQQGFLKNFKIHAAAPAASPAAAQKLLQAVETATDSTTKGSALENLLAFLLRAVPGFEVKQGVRTMTEEIDVKVVNAHRDPRWRDTPIILFECKNWSTTCGKNELVLFERKLENRRGRATLGFIVSWRGFAKTASHELLRGSRGNIQVAFLTGDDLRTAAASGDILPILRDAVDRADDT